MISHLFRPKTPTPVEAIRPHLFGMHLPDASAFAKSHGLDPARVARLFAGEETAFWPAICKAFCAETGMTEQSIWNMCGSNRVAA